MWLIAEFEAATLFSLKMSSATAAGGKTLLVPTPYAVKMALLDGACRLYGVDAAERGWERVRDLELALRPAAQIVVTNLFQRVLRPRRQAANAGDMDAGPFQKTIGYREYAQWEGSFGFALNVNDASFVEWLVPLLLNINYFGKRGSFVQLLPPLRTMEELPDDYVHVTRAQGVFVLNGTLQVLDDCTPTLGFEKANIYSDKKVQMGKDRVARAIVLPNFGLTRSSKAFSLYERVE